ncbi:hypothetical protein GE09DRAFT_1294546 [Coniochaeta sp. 2T2.1]|nr:hypothetical protein GE09DRAFT_1294546 [Coniochaeta sp. 2T2.1]
MANLVTVHDKGLTVSHEAAHPDIEYVYVEPGNPGTGKSTLMKLLFEEVMRKVTDNPSQIASSFFFPARGSLEEKLTTGLYRTILHQLLGEQRTSKESLDWMTAYGARGALQHGWHKAALKQTLVALPGEVQNRIITELEPIDLFNCHHSYRPHGDFPPREAENLLSDEISGEGREEPT